MSMQKSTKREETRKPPAPPVFLSTAELSRRWGISANTLRHWRFKGVGPQYFKPSGPLGIARYRIEDVLAWEEEHTQGPGGG